MATILEEVPVNLSYGEEIMYEFIRKQLPDYIYASMCPTIRVDGARPPLELDMLILVPHMGAFILDISNVSGISCEEGEYRYRYADGRIRSVTAQKRQGRLKSQVFGLRDYLKKKFNISPLVYEFECFPYLRMKNLDKDRLPPDFDPEHVISADDLESGLTFLHKIIGCTIRQQKLYDLDRFEDLSDRDVHDTFFFWETGLALPPRPARPPVVFLSYNRHNNEMSKNVQTFLEDRGIFVWRAPRDVPAGEDYFPHEMKAIEECDLFLILLSSAAQESVEVRKEFEKAVELDKDIFPVWVEDIRDTEINDYYREHLTRYQYRIMPRMKAEVLYEIVANVKRAKEANDAKLS